MSLKVLGAGVQVPGAGGQVLGADVHFVVAGGQDSSATHLFRGLPRAIQSIPQDA
jgi:hypothetical protein